MFQLTHYYFFLFGALTIVGGIIGYVKAQSRASLIAGGISGVLLIAVAAWMATSRTPALVTGLVLSLLLAGRFGSKLRQGGRFMPAGLMTILGVIGTVLTLILLLAPSVG